MRELPFADGEFASVLSVQSIEHVPDPERVIAEVVRVLEPGGVAIFVTPNRLTFARADEIIDPYHYVEYSTDQLAALCGGCFAEVELHGLFGSASLSASWSRPSSSRLDRLLRTDPLRLRRLVPRRARQRLYDCCLPAPARARSRRRGDRGRRLPLRSEDLDRSLDLIAVCRAAAG